MGGPGWFRFCLRCEVRLLRCRGCSECSAQADRQPLETGQRSRSGSAGKDKKEASQENGAETTSAAAEPVESAATGEAEAVEIADSSALTPPPAVDDEEKDDRDE